jgi:hypothetical protein
MAVEIERDSISSRTTEALHYRKAQGMKLSCPIGAGKSKLYQYRVESKLCYRMSVHNVLLLNDTEQMNRFFKLDEER